MVDPVTRLESDLQHVFDNKEYLDIALTHRSMGQANNERLEYLGDALLGFIIADALYQLYPDASEGELTRLRASVVKGETLAKVARKLNLGNYIKLGGGELKSGGWRRNSILANTLEALTGAVYLDAGMEVCRTIVLGLFGDILNKITPDTLIKDPKTRLQEFLQAQQKNLPVYSVVEEQGEAHAKTFTVECQITDMDISVQANGRSKRNAEQAAAERVLGLLKI